MATVILPTVKNQKITTLTLALTTGATTLDVTSATALGIPSISGSNYHLITLIQRANWRRNPESAPETFEIVKVTAVSIGGGTGGSDRLTITRAQDNTTATAFAVGDIAEARMTAGHYDEVVACLNAGTKDLSIAALAMAGAITQASDTDVANIFGRVRLDSRSSDFAFGSHYDMSTTSNYAWRQSASGTTRVNSAAGAPVEVCVANTVYLSISSTTVAVTGALTVSGNTTLGDASTDTITHTGRCLHRTVTDAGPMTATAGTQTEIVYNTSDNKFYGCTVTHASAATWVALS